MHRKSGEGEVFKVHGHCCAHRVNLRTRYRSDIRAHFQFVNFRDGGMESQTSDFSWALECLCCRTEGWLCGETGV